MMGLWDSKPDCVSCRVQVPVFRLEHLPRHALTAFFIDHKSIMRQLQWLHNTAF